ncbi:DUF1217 domain-containing protein [uncultured Sneathiella sp.]|uniref:DUF1217 domain-containing protein n=1 Tax=uncultured Sneathiella sp. TaxID=879315 RepID=UPI0030EB74DF|tara:strand:- start:12273 stop:13055 length:783 start_codon:yes stop_codon:yes gene_type:complete
MQVSTNSSLLWYKLSSTLKDSHMKAFEAQPSVARDIGTFKEKIGEIKSVDDLMKNRTVLTMVLSAFQLESEIDKPAMVRKILTENPADKESLVNRLAEPRWAKLSSALYGLNSDPDFFQKQANIDAILAGYKTNEFEKFEGQNADGVREAMYFKRLAGNVDKLSQIMADKTLMHVVRVSLGLPESFQSLSYEQQRDRLEKQIDIADFKDPKEIDKIIQRFLVYTEINNTDPTSNPILSLFQPISNGDFVGPQPIQIDLFV